MCGGVHEPNSVRTINSIYSLDGFLLLFCYCFSLVEQWLHKLMKYFWKEYLCQILCSVKWKHYVAYSQQKKCYNVILTVPAALPKRGTAWHVASLNLNQPRNDLCLIFLCPSLFICTQPLREGVLKQRFEPTPRDLSVKKSLEKTLVNVAAGFCVLSCLKNNHCF